MSSPWCCGLKRTREYETGALTSEAHSYLLYDSSVGSGFVKVWHIITRYIITWWWLWCFPIFIGHSNWTNSVLLIYFRSWTQTQFVLENGLTSGSVNPFIWAWMSEVTLWSHTEADALSTWTHSEYDTQFNLCQGTKPWMKSAVYSVLLHKGEILERTIKQIT